MKALRHLAAACALLVVPAAVANEPATPEPKHPLKPLLWKVEGPGLEKPSWLFGTIHLGSGPIGRLHPAAVTALDGADAVFTEIPMDAATQLGLAKHYIRTDGKRLAESIGEELARKLDAELAAIQPGLNSAPFQPLKTWAIAVTVPMLRTQLKGGRPLDSIVWSKAAEAGKKTAALEKPEDQFAIFDRLKEEEQVILLAESLRLQKEARLDKTDPVQPLIDAYVAGDAEAVEAEMEKQFVEMADGGHKELGERLLKELLDDRNVTMAAGIDAQLRENPAQSHFFAVGTGHYVGQSNIRDLLTDKGYTITRVTE